MRGLIDNSRTLREARSSRRRKEFYNGVPAILKDEGTDGLTVDDNWKKGRTLNGNDKGRVREIQDIVKEVI